MKRVWKIFWGLTIIESLVGIGGIFRVAPSERAALFGLSPARLGLALIFAAAIVFAGLRLRSGSASFERASLGRIALWAGWLSACAWAFFSSPYARGVNYDAILVRIFPLLLFATVFAVQALVFSALDSGRLSGSWKSARTPSIFAVFVFLFMTGLRFFALKTGLGLEAVSGTFYRQGVSILEGPLILPLLIAAPVIFLAAELMGRERIRAFLDGNRALLFRALFFAVWLIAAIVWANVPFEGRSYFLPAQRPPNFNFYPSSDAENYDLLALNLFNGNGFRNGMTVVRPLYVVFLAVLHQFAGTDYLDLTTLQIIVLALIPALVFRLGVRLRSPWAGTLAAAWVIAREIYAIRLTPLVQVSNSRLLLSELPMTLIILWIANLTTDWLYESAERGSARWRTVILTAAACGMGVLVRTQSVVLIPAVLLVIFVFNLLQARRTGRDSGRTKRTAVFLTLSVLIVSPWVIYQRVFPNPTASSGSGEGAYLNRLYARAAGLPEGKAGSILSFLRRNPARIGAEVGAHLINNLLSTVLVLPLRTEPADDPERWFFDSSNFWYRVSSRPVLESCSAGWLVVSLIFAIGVGGAVSRRGFPVLVPAALYGAYAGGCALALNSGFRFILPVDWFALFLFALGFETVFRFAIGAARPDGETVRDEVPPRRRSDERAAIVWASGLCLFIAGLLPVMDFPGTRTRPLPTQSELFHDWRAARTERAAFVETSAIGERIDQGELEFVSGLAVYPRVYPAREGDADGVSSIKRGAEFPRLVWMVLSDDQRVFSAALPLSCREVFGALPDPVRITALGSRSDDYFAILTIDTVEPDPARSFHFESAGLFNGLSDCEERR